MSGRCLIVFLVLSMACTHRNHDNPLDVHNGDTQGMPQGLRITSAQHDVRLKWREPDLEDLDHVLIYRRISDELEFKRIAEVAPGLQAYTDSNRQYDKYLTYQIGFEGAGWSSQLSDSVSIMPGPHRFWITDYMAGTITQLTYDATHISFALPFAFFPRDVAIDTLQDILWAADWTGYVLRYNLETEQASWFSGFIKPTRIVFDNISGLTWVVVKENTKVIALNSSGEEQILLDQFTEITDIVTADDGGVWIADGGAYSLVRILADGSTETIVLEQAPLALSSMSEGRGLWIASAQLLQTFSLSGVYGTSYNLENIPRAISAIGDSLCWVAFTDTDHNGAAYLFNTSGNTVEINDLLDPVDILAVPSDGGCVIVESWAGKVSRFNRWGTVIGSRGNFAQPERIILE